MPPNYHVVRANLTYARRIPGVHIRSAKVTYKDDLPHEYLTSLRVADMIAATRQHVQDPRRCMFVLLYLNRVVGYIEAGEVQAPGEALLINEYMEADHCDNGLGSFLLLPAVQCLLAKNRWIMAGHVAQTNAKMQHVATTKWGGHFHGEVQMQMGPHLVAGFEYVWELNELWHRLQELCNHEQDE